MEQGSFRAVRRIVFLFVMIGLAGFSLYGDEYTTDYISIILDPFDGTTSREWSFGGKTYSFDYEWRLDASKFASNVNNENFPKQTYVPVWPIALFGTNRDGKNLKSFGIWGKFDRRGYNWIDIYPVKAESDPDDPEPFEIPIPGRLQYMDMWVWGSNLNFYMEAYFRDYQGVVHCLHMGNLAYQGWRNLRVRIPTSMPQAKRVLPRLANLTFVKFRVWTTPMERVDNFYVYFNQMKILTDTFESLYDGDELGDPERVQELWGQEQVQR